MCVEGLLPTDDDCDDALGDFLTFIVPAPLGCNLKCPFCIVRQRREIAGPCLRPTDLERFIREAARHAPVFALSVQGVEPLLPGSRQHTEAVLATGRSLNIPTAFVTNGVYLSGAAEWLAQLVPTKIAVSVDAASSEVHDKIRGVPGAWEITFKGIEHALQVLSPRTRIAVTSVLMSDPAPLINMPSLLRNIGINDWIITPLKIISDYKICRLFSNSYELYKNLKILQNAADRAGIRLTVDDELNHLNHDHNGAREPSLRQLRVRTLPRGLDLVRLLPGGQCAMNHEILRQVTAQTPRWLPGEVDAGEFIADLKITQKNNATSSDMFRRGVSVVEARMSSL